MCVVGKIGIVNVPRWALQELSTDLVSRGLCRMHQQRRNRCDNDLAIGNRCTAWVSAEECLVVSGVPIVTSAAPCALC